jgi:1-acyl-sn-glycerol-3-phosphate acyltransferase
MRAFILLILYIFLAVLILPVLFLCFFLRITGPLYGYVKAAIGLAPKILGIKIHVSGQENVDRRQTYVFMANHLSFMDGPLLLWLIPHHARVIFKKELIWVPIIGLGMKYVQFIPVDRKGKEAGKMAIKKAAHLMRTRGFSFLIFPEGTRTRTGRMGDFRHGGFYLALETGIQILPITITGTYDLMPKGKFRIKKGVIRVVYHPAIPVDGYAPDRMPELTARVRGQITGGLKEEEEP